MDATEDGQKHVTVCMGADDQELLAGIKKKLGIAPTGEILRFALLRLACLEGVALASQKAGVKTYMAVIEQEDEGCNNSICCGMRVVFIEHVSSPEEALEELLRGEGRGDRWWQAMLPQSKERLEEVAPVSFDSIADRVNKSTSNVLLLEEDEDLFWNMERELARGPWTEG